MIRGVAAGLAVAYPRVWALGGRGSNTLVVASASELDLDRVSARAAADPSPARLTGPGEMARLVQSAEPLHDGRGEAD
jgi:hypothetical protein